MRGVPHPSTTALSCMCCGGGEGACSEECDLGGWETEQASAWSSCNTCELHFGSLKEPPGKRRMEVEGPFQQRGPGQAGRRQGLAHGRPWGHPSWLEDHVH